jgi:hypothetical protein
MWHRWCRSRSMNAAGDHRPKPPQKVMEMRPTTHTLTLDLPTDGAGK